ncbi:MAG: hypothetical protein LUQ65_09560 [Candidatus Helarchaeota archaeon]|nr:hypothetical protein [Candidatus Helarchaeota archaeon]
MKELRKYFLLLFLLVFTALPSVDANGWGDPLVTDSTGDGSVAGEDILAVDAQYANDFVYFRFQLNEPLHTLEYGVFIGYDNNLNNSYSVWDPELDSGPDVFTYATPGLWGSDAIIEVHLFMFGHANSWVRYNVTASNRTAMAWSAPDIVPYIALYAFMNDSQVELAFGMNWTWVVSQMSDFIWNGQSLYLEFRSTLGGTDWCPDRTLNSNDYITWDLFPQGGIPSFTTPLAVFSLLTLLALILIFERKPLKF